VELVLKNITQKFGEHPTSKLLLLGEDFELISLIDVSG
jgi:hypothetical protein